MSPKNKKIKKIRYKLDKLDNSFILIKKENKSVKEVLKVETIKNEIVDKKRILIILKNIIKKIFKIKD